MLHVQFFSSVFELVDAAFHLLKVGVDLGAVLIVDVHDFNQAFLEKQPLFF